MSETAGATVTTPTAHEVAAAWLADFGTALESRDAAAATGLISPDGWWRDLLAMTWDLRTLHGTEQIAAMLEERLDATAFSGLTLTEGKPPELVELDEDTSFVQGFFDFETAIARGRGVFRLVADGDDWKAWTVLTAMVELKGHEEPLGPRRAKGVSHGEQRDREIWLDRRRRDRDFLDSEPQVLVIGSGQGGLTAAARLGQLGVDTLVIEKNDRIGDNWRKRYRSLVLHDPVWYDHMPYLPFPEHWPVFTPKDKLADWFETYASAMELNVWTQTELLGATYDDASGQWTVAVRRADGEERTLHPSHVVLATGASGEPRVPEFDGVGDFKGVVNHSSAHPGGRDFAGKRAIVVGSCNSGHDIAQDFFEQGADVTMVQRSSTYVMSSENGIAVLFAGFYEEGGPTTDDADLLFAAIPFPVLAQLHVGATEALKELDKEMLEGLERAAVQARLRRGRQRPVHEVPAPRRRLLHRRRVREADRRGQGEDQAGRRDRALHRGRDRVRRRQHARGRRRRAGHGLRQHARDGAAAVRRRGRRPLHARVGAGRGRGAAHDLARLRAPGPVVHGRQPAPLALLLALPRPTDQGARGGHPHRVNVTHPSALQYAV